MTKFNYYKSSNLEIAKRIEHTILKLQNDENLLKSVVMGYPEVVYSNGEIVRSLSGWMAYFDGIAVNRKDGQACSIHFNNIFSEKGIYAKLFAAEGLNYHKIFGASHHGDLSCRLKETEKLIELVEFFGEDLVKKSIKVVEQNLKKQSTIKHQQGTVIIDSCDDIDLMYVNINPIGGTEAHVYISIEDGEIMAQELRIALIEAKEKRVKEDIIKSISVETKHQQGHVIIDSIEEYGKMYIRTSKA